MLGVVCRWNESIIRWFRSTRRWRSIHHDREIEHLDNKLPALVDIEVKTIFKYHSEYFIPLLTLESGRNKHSGIGSDGAPRFCDPAPILPQSHLT